MERLPDWRPVGLTWDVPGRARRLPEQAVCQVSSSGVGANPDPGARMSVSFMLSSLVLPL